MRDSFPKRVRATRIVARYRYPGRSLSFRDLEAIAELYNVESGAAIADVACFEDQYGLAVSGALRPDVDLPDGELSGSYNLRNFRLPDPPRSHRGVELTDLRFATLAEMAVSYLEAQVVDPALARFGATTE
ncbi:hypothetical protein V2S04_08510 [Microbacterium sp. OR21]|uniref:hypothetical protein n=1 Tax=Microbacterium sp. OR21 TaxID=3095346 RepID=UPI0039B5C07F